MYYQTSMLRDFVYGAVAHGADLQELCRRLDLSPDMLADGEGKVPLETGEAGDFWTEAVRLTGDSSLALHMGEQSTHSSFGMLGYLAQSCRNLIESATTVCKYNDTVSEVFKYSMEIGKTEVVITFTPLLVWEKKFPLGVHQAVDMSMSSFVRSFRSLTGKKIYPLRVELRYPKRDIEEYERILRAPVTFNSSRNCFVMKKSDMETPILSYDKSLFMLFNSMLAKKQQMLKAEQKVSDKVKQLLLTHFNGQATPLKVVASQLHMSNRTLQRKILEEKTSYRKISNEVRKELAEELLSSGNSKKEDVAYFLGYSDASTFRRALRNWQ